MEWAIENNSANILTHLRQLGYAIPSALIVKYQDILAEYLYSEYPLKVCVCVSWWMWVFYIYLVCDMVCTCVCVYLQNVYTNTYLSLIIFVIEPHFICLFTVSLSTVNGSLRCNTALGIGEWKRI